MTLTLYYQAGSYFSQKVRLVLEEKGLHYDEVFVNLVMREVDQPHYLKNINPQGKVPVLKHGDEMITNSEDIVRHLEKHFPERPLLKPEGSPEAAELDEWIAKLEGIGAEVLSHGSMVFPHLTTNSRVPSIIAQKYKAKILEKRVSKLCKENIIKYPELAEHYTNKMKMNEKLETEAASIEAVCNYIKKARQLMNDLEIKLSKHAESGNADWWILGEDFTYADCYMAVAMERLYFLGLWATIADDGRHPLVLKYRQRVHERPAVQKAVVKAYDMRGNMLTLAKTMLPGIALPIGIGSALLVGCYCAYKYFKK